ncbi:MAG: hypothetical protein Kow0029_07260 [Candidatus Rifleibacteriota bacterium]
MSEDSHLINEWFEQHRLELTGNGNWLAGGEPNTLSPDNFEDSAVKVLIARLSSYRDVAKGITHSYLYAMAASVEGSYVDMAFFPEFKDEKLLTANNIPLWVGTSSKRPPAEFDLIAISNSVLQELINLPAAMKKSNIPLSALERERLAFPVVIIGGSNSYNLSILYGLEGNSLVDGVLVGEGEGVWPRIIELVRDNKNKSRKELLALLTKEVPGFYDPALYGQFFAEGRLVEVKPLGDAPFPLKSSKTACNDPSDGFCTGPILYDEEAAGSSHLLATAGCPSFCSFCKESWEQKPYRERTLSSLLHDAMKLKASMGLSEISIMSFNATTYSNIFELVEKLNHCFYRVSIKSQRFDAVVEAPELLDLQFDSGKRTYTCAMEGLSERLRKFLQKNLSERTILNGIAHLVKRKMRQLKVFLILTGYENKKDQDEFTDFLKKLKDMLGVDGARVKVTFSFACLFRPPHTPLQFAGPGMSFEEMSAKLEELILLIRKHGFEARISAGPADAFVSEFIAYADRRYTEILIKASVEKGFRYRGEVPPDLLLFMEDEINNRGIKPISRDNRNENTVFPWDDICTGVSKKFLYENYLQLTHEKELVSCIAAPWGSGYCAGCGACANAEQKRQVNSLGPKINRGFKLSSARKTFQFAVVVKIPKRWNWCGKQFVKAAIARKLMLDNPEIVKSFLRTVQIVPEFYSFGLAVAIIESSEPVNNIICHENSCDENDISILGLLKNGELKSEYFWPIEIKAVAKDEIQQLARKYDGFLVKRQLKHLKQRSGEFLCWNINKGHAKKSGLASIRLNEVSGLVFMELLQMPEIYLLNLFLDKLEIETVKINGLEELRIGLEN